MRTFIVICTTLFPFWITAQDPFAGTMQEILNLRSAGKVVEARDAFQQLSKELPTYLPARLEWAVCESFLGHFDVSVALYDEILSQNPENEFALVGKIRTLFWQGKWEQVKRNLTIALRRFPDHKELSEIQNKVQSFYQNEIQITQHNIAQQENRLQQQQITFKRQFATHTSVALQYQQGADSLKQFELGFTRAKANMGAYIGLQKIWNNTENIFGFKAGVMAKVAQKWWVVLDYAQFTSKDGAVKVKGIALQRKFIAAAAQLKFQDTQGQKRASVLLSKSFYKNDILLQLTRDLQKKGQINYGLSWRYALNSRFNLGIQFDQHSHYRVTSFGFGIKG